MSSRRLTVVGLSLAVVASACNSNNPNPVGPPPGVGLGAACNADVKCRAGLACGASGTCEGARATADGEPCTLGVECTSGLCGPNGARGVCVAAGAGTHGSSCKGDSDCSAGLKCGFDGQSLFPRCLPAGTKDTGAACTLGLECAQGLLCVSQVCAVTPLPPASAPNGLPPFLPQAPGTGWQGAQCEAAKPQATTALWVLPRASDADAVKQDFYRLPFPNDALRGADGRIDFSRHPKDPAPMFGFDVLGRYLEALADQPWSSSPTMLFRFDGPIDFGTLTLQGTSPTLRFVKLSGGAGERGPRGLSILSSSGGNRYICNNWIGVRPYEGDSLTPGVWGVVLLNGIKARDGSSLTQSPDFAAMLSATQPTEAAQAAAWPKYQALRDFLAAESIPPADVLAANAFTVEDPQRLMKSLAAAAEAGAAPTAGTWVKCGGATASPCPDVSGARACGTSTSFDEWHALVELPVFQQGTAPYLTPAQGGAIATADGGAVEVRREQVCATLTTPAGAAPDGGWPVVVYAHGTGGTFRSHAGDGAGAGLAAVTLTADGGAQVTVGAAVLGFDQVGHGPRRGPDGQSTSPDDIVFNFANPASARGTMAQGGADLHSVLRYVKGLGATPAPELPALDTSRVVFWGHSQGATEGALFLAGDRRTDGALLTGASASLLNALMSKRRPIDIAGGLWVALSEASPQSVSHFHPVLGLLQMWTDPVDPLHFARHVAVVPADGAAAAHARNVFQVWGKADLFTARPVQAAFAMGAGLQFVRPEVDPPPQGAAGLAPPVASSSGNVTNPRTVTAAVRQYAPDGGADGHFVVFNEADARQDAARFVGRVLRGEVPTIPEP